MPPIELQDINALSDLAIIFSCLFLFYKWRKRNYDFALSFLIIVFVFLGSALLNIFRVQGDVNFFLRGINSVIFTISLTYACTRILTNCKKLYPVFALYMVFPFSFFLTNDLNNIYVLLRLIGFIILLPYFILLFAVESREMKLISLLGIGFVATSLLFFNYLLIRPEIEPTLPWFVPKIFLALMFIGLSHFSIHMHDGIIDHHFRKRKGKK